MWWLPTEPGPVPVTLPDPHGRSAQTPAELAHLISLLVLDDAVASLVTAIEIETNLSSHISWGNVASSLVGATVVLSRQLPDRAVLAADICRRVLGSALLADAGDYDPGGQFRRRSCCLFYRLPRAGLCGDCALVG